MAKYRKKPIIIEAEQYREGLEDGFEEVNQHMTVDGKGIRTPYIQTLEGKMWISPTDWIITGVRGERYPCKDDIFRTTYEPVEQEQAHAPYKPRNLEYKSFDNPDLPTWARNGQWS